MDFDDPFSSPRISSNASINERDFKAASKISQYCTLCFSTAFLHWCLLNCIVFSLVWLSLIYLLLFNLFVHWSTVVAIAQKLLTFICPCQFYMHPTCSHPHQFCPATTNALYFLHCAGKGM